MSVELTPTLFTPRETAEPCFTCDECRCCDGDHSKKSQWRKSCERYQTLAKLEGVKERAADWRARQRRLNFRVIKGGNYMSKTREPWWGFCRNIVRMYPAYLERYRALHDVSMTANYTGLPGDSTPSRSTEDVATRELTQTEQKSLDAVEAAIRATLRRKDGEERLRLIGLVYWPKRYDQALTLKEACFKVNISERTAWRWHRDFILTVARYRGLLD